jgi:RsiW-degrading membrane proteinase PrsW (M82 family)
MTDKGPDLSDPDYARFAWARYRRLMAWMALVAVAAVAVALAYLRHANGPIPIHMLIATTLGIGLSVMLCAALMGLVFLSSGSGHDETIHDHSEDETR